MGYLYPREGSSDRQQASDSTIARSLLVTPGQLVINPMWLTGGSVSVSGHSGAVSPDYRVFNVDPMVEPRFAHFVLRSRPYMKQYALFVRANTTFDRRVQQDDIDSMPLLLPEREEQRRIADFLDDRVSRIDHIIAARREQATLVTESSSRLSYDCIRGAIIEGERRRCRLDWLGSVPQTWPVVSVDSQFTVELGKMLDDKRQTGEHRLPYLRNTNVQWDEISVDDLKEMDIPTVEYSRYTVDAGDLLICEGGKPGRSAIWMGAIRPIGFQKALHRARSRGRSSPQWLLECLRVAVDLDVFIAGTGQTTIAHLTNEQLREQRFPFPEPQIQMALLQELNEKRHDMKHVIAGLARSNDLLAQYKSSLITAAVTGELDVTTAGSGIPG